jgi:hypothetical protein
VDTGRYFDARDAAAVSRWRNHRDFAASDSPVPEGQKDSPLAAGGEAIYPMSFRDREIRQMKTSMLTATPRAGESSATKSPIGQ